MADDTKDAFFSLTQAEYAAGDFKKAVLEGNMVAQVRVTSAVDNVAGVKLPVFNLQDTGAVSDNQTLGLVGGGKKVRGGRKGESRVVVNGDNATKPSLCSSPPLDQRIQGSFQPRPQEPRQAGVPPDFFCDPRRGHEGHQPPCERPRERHHP